MSDIVKWEKIQDQFCDGLLLGNGASKAVHSNFDYQSLFDAAISYKYITPAVAEIFKQFDTQDFELVLRDLWRAKLVNEALNISFEKIEIAYTEVQNALISTIQKIHPSYSQVETHLKPIYQFMKCFKMVFSLNYDLIIYWATQRCNKENKNRFKDCFIKGIFIDNINSLRDPYNKADGTTLFFYPHGNLALVRTDEGKETKITVPANEKFSNLLDAILEQWKLKNCVPLFVCEGSTKHKKQAIKNASYLSRVYHEVMPSIEESLVIYGWSMADADQHIFDQIQQSEKLKRVAISVHEHNTEYTTLVQKKLQGQNLEIIFFDAASPGCWNNTLISEVEEF